MIVNSKQQQQFLGKRKPTTQQYPVQRKHSNKKANALSIYPKIKLENESFDNISTSAAININSLIIIPQPGETKNYNFKLKRGQSIQDQSAHEAFLPTDIVENLQISELPIKNLSSQIQQEEQSRQVNVNLNKFKSSFKIRKTSGNHVTVLRNNNQIIRRLSQNNQSSLNKSDILSQPFHNEGLSNSMLSYQNPVQNQVSIINFIPIKKRQDSRLKLRDNSKIYKKLRVQDESFIKHNSNTRDQSYSNLTINPDETSNRDLKQTKPIRNVKSQSQHRYIPLKSKINPKQTLEQLNFKLPVNNQLILQKNQQEISTQHKRRNSQHFPCELNNAKKQKVEPQQEENFHSKLQKVKERQQRLKYKSIGRSEVPNFIENRYTTKGNEYSGLAIDGQEYIPKKIVNNRRRHTFKNKRQFIELINQSIQADSPKATQNKIIDISSKIQQAINQQDQHFGKCSNINILDESINSPQKKSWQQTGMDHQINRIYDFTSHLQESYKHDEQDEPQPFKMRIELSNKKDQSLVKVQEYCSAEKEQYPTGSTLKQKLTQKWNRANSGGASNGFEDSPMKVKFEEEPHGSIREESSPIKKWLRINRMNMRQ